MNRYSGIYPSASQMYETWSRPEIAHFTNGDAVATINRVEDPITFAAVKLLQELCRNGKISDEVFCEILEENADRIDVSKFKLNDSDGEQTDINEVP